MMMSRCVPLSQRFRAASSLILPEPTNKTQASCKLGKSRCASRTATWLTEAALRLMPVSLRARLPATRAARKRAEVIGPA